MKNLIFSQMWVYITNNFLIWTCCSSYFRCSYSRYFPGSGVLQHENVSAMLLYHIQALLHQIKTVRDQAKDYLQVFFSTAFVVIVVHWARVVGITAP
jgi:hypothetical protein